MLDTDAQALLDWVVSCYQTGAPSEQTLFRYSPPGEGSAGRLEQLGLGAVRAVTPAQLAAVVHEGWLRTVYRRYLGGGEPATFVSLTRRGRQYVRQRELVAGPARR